MLIDVVMPCVRPGLREARIRRWLVCEGQPVTPGCPMAEIAVDDGDMVEIAATEDGVISGLVVQVGSVVPVGAVIARLSARGVGIGGARASVSPLVRRLAERWGLDLRAIRGTGPLGRIVRRDLDAALAGQRRGLGAVGVRPGHPAGDGEDAESRSELIAEPMGVGEVGAGGAGIWALACSARVDRLLGLARDSGVMDSKGAVEAWLVQGVARACCALGREWLAMSGAVAAGSSAADVAEAVAGGRWRRYGEGGEVVGLGAVAIGCLGGGGVAGLVVPPPEGYAMAVTWSEPEVRAVIVGGDEGQAVVAGTMVAISLAAWREELSATEGAELLRRVKAHLEEPPDWHVAKLGR